MRHISCILCVSVCKEDCLTDSLIRQRIPLSILKAWNRSGDWTTYPRLFWGSMGKWRFEFCTIAHVQHSAVVTVFDERSAKRSIAFPPSVNSGHRRELIWIVLNWTWIPSVEGRWTLSLMLFPWSKSLPWVAIIPPPPKWVRNIFI